MARELDLPHIGVLPSGVNIHIYLTKLLQLFEEVRKKSKVSRVLRFFAFKTTMGMDEYPSPYFSFSHLFEPSSESYSSVSLTSAAIVQGVLIPQELTDLLQEDDILRYYLDKTFEVHHRVQEYSM